MRLLLLAALTLSVASCGPTIVVMKNPQTGELKQCGNPMGVSRLSDASAASDCAAGYQAAGWQRLN